MAKLLDFPDQELQELRIIIKMGPEKEKKSKKLKHHTLSNVGTSGDFFPRAPMKK